MEVLQIVAGSWPLAAVAITAMVLGGFLHVRNQIERSNDRYIEHRKNNE